MLQMTFSRPMFSVPYCAANAVAAFHRHFDQLLMSGRHMRLVSIAELTATAIGEESLPRK